MSDPEPEKPSFGDSMEKVLEHLQSIRTLLTISAVFIIVITALYAAWSVLTVILSPRL